MINSEKKNISFLQLSETFSEMNFMNNNVNMNNYKVNGMDQMSNMNMNQMNNGNINQMNSGSMNEMNNANMNQMNNAYMNQMNNGMMNQMSNGNMNQVGNGNWNQMNNMNMNQMANSNMDQMNNSNMYQMGNTNMDQMNNMNQMSNTNMNQMNNPNMFQMNNQNMNQVPNTYTNKMVTDTENSKSLKSDAAEVNFTELSSKSKLKTNNSIIYSKPRESTNNQDLQRYSSIRDSEMKKLQSNHTWKNAKRESINDKFDKYAASTGVKNADEFVSFLGYLSDASIKATKMYASSQNEAK
jgi:hypothetical protein